MKILVHGVLLATIIFSLSSCNTFSEVSSGSLSNDRDSTQSIITGKVSNDRNYSGQDCVMYNDSWYWTESKGYILSEENFQMVGIIEKMVDKVPTENYTSAKSKAGSKIFIKKDDDNHIYIEGELEPGKQVLISFARRSYK